MKGSITLKMDPLRNMEILLQMSHLRLPAGRAWTCTSSAMTGRL